MPNKYINPFTDFGFKRLFGEEFNKDLLMDFLNQLLKEEEGEITSLTYLHAEQLGTTEFERRVVYDLYCENQNGEKFIVELQKAKQNYFKDRSVFYSSFPIQKQAVQGGDWDFKLKAVYTIGILDFVFDEDKADPDKMLYKVKLSDIETKKVFYDKLTYIYIEMPKFKKTEDELETKFDKWLYVLKNLSTLEQFPKKWTDRIFTRLFELAEIAQFSDTDRAAYEQSVKVYRDWRNVWDTAMVDAEVRGRAEGKAEIVRGMSDRGMSRAEIATLIGFDESEIERLLT